MNHAERAGVTRLVTACRYGGKACGSGREWFE